jgi:hypothetical protein
MTRGYYMRITCVSRYYHECFTYLAHMLCLRRNGSVRFRRISNRISRVIQL